MSAVEDWRSRDPNDWRVKEYDRKNAKRGVKTCSYCKTTGHNRKTCERLKTELGEAQASCREWRQEALRGFSDIGLGVGTLVKFHNRIGLVTGFRWPEASQMCAINPEWYWTNKYKKGHHPAWLIGTATPRLLEVNTTGNKSVRWEFPQHPLLAPYSRVLIISPVTTTFERSVPTDWENGDIP